MKLKDRIIAVIVFTSVGFMSVAGNAAVIYNSVPDLDVEPVNNAWCSSCAGSNEPLDNFTLNSAKFITGFDLVTQTGFFEGLGGFTVEIYDSSHTAIIFSQAVVPTLVFDTSFETSIVAGTISGLHLSAGSYWIGFVAFNLALPGFADGNGSMFVSAPDTGTFIQIGRDQNIGYQLQGSNSLPEPSTWAMMILGFFGLASLQARRQWRNRRSMTAA